MFPHKLQDRNPSGSNGFNGCHLSSVSLRCHSHACLRQVVIPHSWALTSLWQRPLIERAALEVGHLLLVERADSQLANALTALALPFFPPSRHNSSYMHLIFSEWVITEETRHPDKEHFFRRNGARKDPGWNKRTKHHEVRVMWENCLNKAWEQAGFDARVDARSWSEQGRDDLSGLREPKLLAGKGPAAPEARARVNQLCRQRQRFTGGTS